jgi:hypothetical protein
LIERRKRALALAAFSSLGIWTATAGRAQLSPAGYAPEGYELVFQDEFSGSTLDTNKWFPLFFPHWSGEDQENGEQAEYEVSGGSIKLRRDNSDPVWSPHPPLWGAVSGLVSGMYSGATGSKVGLSKVLCSDPGCGVWSEYANWNYKYAVTQYGYFEMRARGCETGYCAWWMIGFEENPQHSGEIDIMELYRYHQAPAPDTWPDDQCMHFGTHAHGDPNFTSASYFYGTDDCLPFGDLDWHTYGLLWTPSRLTLYIDGVYSGEYSHSPKYPMVSIFSTHLGVPYDPVGSVEFEIDYFRIFKSLRHTGSVATMIPNDPGFGTLPANAVDDSDSTLVMSDDTFDWDLKVDLGSVQPIEKIEILPDYYNYATNFILKGSVNGTSWTQMKSVSNASNLRQEHLFTPSTNNYRYVLMEVNSDAGQWPHAVREFQVFTTAPVLQKVPSTATMLNGSPGWGNVASRAVDGNSSTYAAAYFPDYNWDLEIDLGSTREIARVVVDANYYHHPISFEVLVSVDHVNWSTVRSVTDGTYGPRTIDFLASGRYVKLEVSSQSMYSGGSYPHAIHEVEVWASR